MKAAFDEYARILGEKLKPLGFTPSGSGDSRAFTKDDLLISLIYDFRDKLVILSAKKSGKNFGKSTLFSSKSHLEEGFDKELDALLNPVTEELFVEYSQVFNDKLLPLGFKAGKAGKENVTYKKGSLVIQLSYSAFQRPSIMLKGTQKDKVVGTTSFFHGENNLRETFNEALDKILNAVPPEPEKKGLLGGLFGKK